MTNTSEAPRSEVERRHLEYLSSRGVDPSHFLIEAQLERWEEQQGRSLTDAEQTLLRQLAARAPSRFELAHLLHMYDIARTNIRTMQVMSHDRQDFNDIPFVIGTEPEGLVATATTSWLPASCSDQEGVNRSSHQESVIWLPVQGMQRALQIANLVAARLVPRFGDLYHLTRALAYNVTWDEVVALLRPSTPVPRDAHYPASSGRRLPGIIWVEPQPGESAMAQEVLVVALSTFEAGHEAGHFYHGHTGLWQRTSAYRRLPTRVPASWEDEASADTVGIVAVWDGMSANQEISIDLSWAGPILSLATWAGLCAYSLNDDADAEEKYLQLLFRLEGAIRSIAANLRGNGFEIDRSAVILSAALTLAVAIYEYIRCGGDFIDEQPGLGQAGANIYASLEPVCMELLESLR